MSPPPNDPPGFNAGSLLNIGNVLQSIAQAITLAVTELQQMMPAFSSGQISQSMLVFTGFVRVTGVSVVSSGAPVGALFDAPNLAASNTGNKIYPIPQAVGYTSTQMIFENGLVYRPGTGESIAVFYVRS